MTSDNSVSDTFHHCHNRDSLLRPISQQDQFPEISLPRTPGSPTLQDSTWKLSGTSELPVNWNHTLNPTGWWAEAWLSPGP